MGSLSKRAGHASGRSLEEVFEDADCVHAVGSDSARAVGIHPRRLPLVPENQFRSVNRTGLFCHDSLHLEVTGIEHSGMDLGDLPCARHLATGSQGPSIKGRAPTVALEKRHQVILIHRLRLVQNGREFTLGDSFRRAYQSPRSAFAGSVLAAMKAGINAATEQSKKAPPAIVQISDQSTFAGIAEIP